MEMYVLWVWSLDSLKLLNLLGKKIDSLPMFYITTHMKTAKGVLLCDVKGPQLRGGCKMWGFLFSNTIYWVINYWSLVRVRAVNHRENESLNTQLTQPNFKKCRSQFEKKKCMCTLHDYDFFMENVQNKHAQIVLIDTVTFISMWKHLAIQH